MSEPTTGALCNVTTNNFLWCILSVPTNPLKQKETGESKANATVL